MELAEASAICRVLSDPHRLVILEQLMEREQCGSELLKKLLKSPDICAGKDFDEMR